MKKILLAAIAALSIMSANAQTTVTEILYNSDGSGPFGNPYPLGAVGTTGLATIGGLSVITTTGTGGFGNGIPAQVSGYTQIPFIGTTGTSYLVFDAQWDGTTSLQIDFKYTGSTANLRVLTVTLPGASSINFQTISVPAASFLQGWGYGAPLTDAELQSLTEFQLVPNTNNSVFAITNIKLVGKSAVTGLAINSSSNSTISDGIVVSPNPSNQGSVSIKTSFNVYGATIVNSQGIQVNAPVNGNTVNTAGLTPGVYTILVNTDNGTIAKKVIVE